MSALPVNFGVIGVGGMGAEHAHFVAELDETRLVAVADSDGNAAKAVACKLGCATEKDEAALLHRDDIAAVIIATPHPLHASTTIAAAQRGIHVLCEKPLDVAVGAADAMIAACRANRVLLGTVFQQRTEPSRRRLQRMVAAGELGEIYRVSHWVSLYRPQAYYDSAAWRGTWRGEGGGILMQAAHALDQLAWLAGMPQRIQALTLTRLHHIETENTAIAILDYGGGKAGWFSISTADALSGERLEISGESGALVWENDRLHQLKTPQPMSQHLHSANFMFEALGGQWHEVKIDDADQNAPQGYREIVRAFARAVQSGDASLMVASGEDGLRSLELANAIALAAHHGRAVELPLNRAHYQKLLDARCADELRAEKRERLQR